MTTTRRETFAVPRPLCRMGYTDAQVREICELFHELPGRTYEDFEKWFAGQTGAICHGADGCRVAHGEIVYRHDLVQFLRGGGDLEWFDSDLMRVVRERTLGK